MGDLLDPDTGRKLCQVFMDDAVIHSVTWTYLALGLHPRSLDPLVREWLEDFNYQVQLGRA